MFFNQEVRLYTQLREKRLTLYSAMSVKYWRVYEKEQW